MNNELKTKIEQELIKSQIKTGHDLEYFKRKIAKKYKVKCLQSSELLKIYHEIPAKKRVKIANLPNFLIKRPVRSLSGIVNVSVLTKPYPCPGKCIFCPTQKNIPKSYLAKEPAVQRAIYNKFDPYKQVFGRILSLKETGHPIDKVEIRTIGGTWSYYPKKYQKWFISECFRACNNFYSLQLSQKSKCFKYSAIALYLKHHSEKQNLTDLQKQNEKAKCRVVGISIETRPDYITQKEIKWMRELGVTKVELGVQSVDDEILKLNGRGHGVKEIVEATKLLKNAGFKVSFQTMPGLYGSSYKKDLEVFKEIFKNPNFKPDYLKIYPLALVKNTKLYNLYKQGKFKPYSQKELTELLVEIKKMIPKWVRVERIIRDIPSADIVEGGSKILNLREIILKELQKQKTVCQCIRCREVGSYFDAKEKLHLFKEKYQASEGTEIFLSFENKQKTKLYALLRLRLSDTAVIRDLHTYGKMAQIYRKMSPENSVQHKGLGKKLIQEAEKIAKHKGYKKIAIISAIGVRPYYRKLGYRLQNTYMVKTLK